MASIVIQEPVLEILQLRQVEGTLFYTPRTVSKVAGWFSVWMSDVLGGSVLLVVSGVSAVNNQKSTTRYGLFVLLKLKVQVSHNLSSQIGLSIFEKAVPSVVKAMIPDVPQALNEWLNDK